MSKNKPIIADQKTVATSRLFHIQELKVHFDNGEKRDFERLRSRGLGSVMVVALKDLDSFILIREYAAGIDDYILTLPQGRIDQGEALLDAANRELMEEAGYGAKNLSLIRTLAVSPGYMGHFTAIVLAQNLYEKKLDGDEPEPIDVMTWKFSELDKLVVKGEACEPRSIAALYMIREKLHG